MKHIFLKGILWGILAFTVGCTLPRQTEVKRPTLPGAFPAAKADTGRVLPNWRVFFRDSALNALIDTALARNLDLRLAAQRIQLSQAQVSVARGALLPRVDAVVTPSVRRFGLYTMDGAGNSSTDIRPGERVPTNLPDYFVGLQSTWEADLWGKLRNRRRAANARFLASIEGQRLVQTAVVAEIANLYFDALALDNTLVLLDSTYVLENTAYEMAKVQKEAGVTTELAVQQLYAQLMDVRALQAQARQQLVEVENRINWLLGRTPQPIPRNRHSLDHALPDFQSGSPQALFLNRPDLRQAELELRAAQADVAAARAAFLPSFVVNGNVGFQAYRLDLLFQTPESFAFGLFGSLVAPLVNRVAIRAAFRTANAYQLAALYSYQQTALTAYLEVSNELNRLQNLAVLRTARSQQVRALTNSVSISQELFRTGRATYLDILVAQQNALDARLQLVQVRVQRSKSIVTLYRSLGGGWQ